MCAVRVVGYQIGRVIFSTLEKFDGRQSRQLDVREALQIGGRAGRYGGRFPVGYVTTLHQEDYATLKTLLNTPLIPLSHAALSPTPRHLALLSEHRPGASLSSLLQYVQLFAAVDGVYEVARLDAMMSIARALERYPELSFEERFSLCVAPVDMDKPPRRHALLTFVQSYCNGEEVTWRSLQGWTNFSETLGDNDKGAQLLALEDLWHGLDLSAAHSTATARNEAPLY